MREPNAGTFLVDGYNVIRRNPALKAEEDQRGLAAGRDALTGRIQASPVLAHARVIVVFDGASGMAGWTPVSRARLDVRFSRPPQNADQAILSILKSGRDNSRVAVVTADRDLEWEVLKLGARVVSPDEWLSRLAPRRPKQRKAESGPATKPEASRKEVEWGLKTFGDESLEIAFEKPTTPSEYD